MAISPLESFKDSEGFFNRSSNSVIINLDGTNNTLWIYEIINLGNINDNNKRTYQ